MDNLTKELAESLLEMRNFADIGEIPPATYMVRADAVLDRYVDVCTTLKPVITRVEVITDTGRDYVNWGEDNVVTTSLQDEGRTLKVFVTQTERNLKMPITKPYFYDGLPPGEKTMYRVAEKEVSKQWATALSGLIDELGGDSPALWEWNGITPTPEKVVECLRENIQYREQLAADDELERCVEWLGDSPVVWDNNEEVHPGSYLRISRRPQPTLKSQALKDFETVRKHSDLLPEILDTIEKALKSIPDT